MADEVTTASVLNDVRDGGAKVVVMAESRLRDAIEALSNGEFEKAAGRIQEATLKVGALVQAHNALGAFAKHSAVRARDITVGTEMVGYGTVLGINNISEHSDDCDEAVFEFSFENAEPCRAYGVQETLVGEPANTEGNDLA